MRSTGTTDLLFAFVVLLKLPLDLMIFRFHGQFDFVYFAKSKPKEIQLYY